MKIKYEEDSTEIIEVNNSLNYDLELGLAMSESLKQNEILSPEIVQNRVELRLIELLKNS